VVDLEDQMMKLVHLVVLVLVLVVVLGVALVVPVHLAKAMLVVVILDQIFMETLDLVEEEPEVLEEVLVLVALIVMPGVMVVLEFHQILRVLL
jgi:hypothetical protein